MSTNQTTVHHNMDLFQRNVSKMPDGLYSGDKPNPQLRAFVEAHATEKPYDSIRDDYNVPAFDRPIETTKATAIYNMHTYWSKKPHDAIRQYIRHYTRLGDLVLDPFCGSGGTALAALMEGRKAIAIDRSPAATFITKNYCTLVNLEDLESAFRELLRKAQSETDWLYQTRCDRCGGNAVVSDTVYSHVFQCPRCLEKVPLFDCASVVGETAAGKPRAANACPYCYKRGIPEEISTRSERFDAVPVLVNYLCESGCDPANDGRRHDDLDKKKRQFFEKYDLGRLREIEKKQIPHWYPRDRMMHVREGQERWGVKWRAGTSNFRTVDELFTKRNLWALAAYYEAAKSLDKPESRDAVRFGLNAILLAMSRMQGYVEDPRFPNQLMRGTYYVPQISREYNVGQWLGGKLQNLRRGYEKLHREFQSSPAMISTQSATDLKPISNNTVDYVFTDPPYGGSEQHGELNFVWEAWLGFDTYWHDDEIIVNEVRGKTEADWAHMMRNALAECYRVLKPGRWLSLCYHDTSEGTWAIVQDVMAEVGFVVDKSDSALFIDAKQKSYNQLTADKVTKRDLVINFRKPKPGEVKPALLLTGHEDQLTFTDKVRAIISEYLESHPGSTKDRVYDELTSRMVRSGQMEAHNFSELLRQVAEEVREPVKKNLLENEDPNLFGTHEVSRWYLKNAVLAVTDEAESAKEDAAADIVKAFIKAHLKKHPGEEGVHYSDLFEHYIYAVKDKPRRALVDWLPDYFFRTDEGTYRVPSSDDEERLKAEGRAKGTNRHIKRYLAYLEQGIAVPEEEHPNDATLAEWLRHAKRSGLYEQGKLLYEKGGLNPGNLAEEVAVGVEEDYQVCVRALTRAAGTTISRRKKTVA